MSNALMVLPEWAEKLRGLFIAGEANVFILHGNVQDYVLSSESTMSMDLFLGQWMGETQKVLYNWSVYNGLTKTRNIASDIPDSVLGKIKRIDTLLRKRGGDDNGVAVVLEHATALIPGGDAQYRSNDERMLLAALLDWSMDEEISKSNNLVLLLAGSLSELPSELLSNPRIISIEIGLPNEASRLAVIQQRSSRRDPNDKGILRIAQQTAGLKLVQVQSLFGHGKGLTFTQREQLIKSVLAKQSESTPAELQERSKKMADITGGMTPDQIIALLGGVSSHADADTEMLGALMIRKRALIEKECFGLIEFMDTRYGLDKVGGNDKIKKELMTIANTIAFGDKRLAPLGLLAVGAMGAGKTFVIRAFLKEAGLTGLALKNIRSKWVGSSEANLDRVLSTVRAMGPVALVIDEGDRSFGNGEGGDSDGGTSSRIIARLKEFMSDPENRGQVLVILMTNRPDKLDTDIKRPGRLDRKIPFFYADTTDDLRSIAQVLARRYDVDASPLNDAMVVNRMQGYSNADIEALIGLYANQIQAFPDKNKNALFLEVLDDFIPPREGGMIEYMNLLAVKEASRKTLVPERYQHLYEGDNLSLALAKAKAALY